MKKLVSLIACVVLSLTAIAALAEVKTVNVGTEGVYSPFTFVDESGKLTGYDVELIRLVDEKLPEYEFNFVQTAWDGIFLGRGQDRPDRQQPGQERRARGEVPVQRDALSF